MKLYDNHMKNENWSVIKEEPLIELVLIRKNGKYSIMPIKKRT